MQSLKYLLSFLIIALFFCSSCEEHPKINANLIVTDAKIWTANPDQPYAQAMAIAGDTILAIGTTTDMLTYKGDATIDDGRWAEEYIGAERIKTTYAFKSLMDTGAKVAFGSDWAVAPAAPLQGIYAAVTRRTLDGKNPDGWVPEQKISVEQALKAYTIDAAFASFEENVKGSLQVGKLADFVILSEDLLEIDAVKVREVEIVGTYLGGVLVYGEK